MKLLYITNIPAPYRQKRFNTMAEIFPQYGIEFEVLYMAKNEPDREWIIPLNTYNYPHRFFKGLHPVIGRFFAHFNPGLLLRLLKNNYDVAIVGGMASPTHWLAPFFINGNKKQIMSIESNLYSVKRKSGIGAILKKLLLSKSDAYQVTGNPQKEYIEFFYPNSREKLFIKLPNLIDEKVFVDQVNKLRSDREDIRTSIGVDKHTQIWVVPARLIPIKGIIEFIKLLEGINNIVLFLLGDGELATEIEDISKDKKLPVKKVGFVQQQEVIKYYAISDLFVLPSIMDASPLSPIEACAAGLPILVSSRIGNLQDVLLPEINGWCYDPICEIEMAKEIIKKIASLTINDLQVMGSRSREIYDKNFNTENWIRQYAIQILSLRHE